MQSLPGWIQTLVPIVLAFIAAIVLVVHMQDQVQQNRDAISTVDMKVDKVDYKVEDVDDIVRDNQQKLARIQAQLDGLNATDNYIGRILP